MSGALLFIPQFQGQDEAQYRSFDEMTAALRQVVRAHSDIARMESVGETQEGRDVWMVEIANGNGVPVDERPGLLIVANLEGDHLIGSELALNTVQYILTNYETDSDVKERVDNHVFYVFPRLNADAAELMWASIKTGRKTNNRSRDGDNDGRTDEDGPEDLNGDGLITQMRVADPMGEYLPQPDEPRLMKEAEPAEGESGGYKVYWEGFDNDGDGFINEDGPGGVDLNRNFQHAYPYYEPDAGPHMVSEPESRALMDFVVSHRNIALVLTFGESDNLVASPTSSGEVAAARSVALIDYADESNADAGSVGMFQAPTRGFGGFGFFFPPGAAPAAQGGRRPARRPATTVDRSDLGYYTAIGEKYREITGVSQVAMTRAPRGSFFEYAYFQFGVPSFSTPGWGLTDSGEEESESDAPEAGPPAAAAQRPRGMPGGGGARDQGSGRMGAGGSGSGGVDLDILRWLDERNAEGFVDWEEYQHPSLGAVEIGGFAPYAVTNPPQSELTSLGEAHARFAVYLASLFAEVQIVDVQVTNHGGGVFEIKADIENAGFLPTSTAQGVRSRSVAPTMVQLGISPDDLLTGADKTSFFQQLDGSGARESYTWIINGREGATIDLKVRSQKGGSDSATITLR